jgi:hypothetical protein
MTKGKDGAGDAFDGLGPKDARPRLNPAVSAASCVKTPEEYFVLSRVDGNTSFAELCRVSGLGLVDTVKLLRRFKEAGLLLVPGEAAPAAPPPAPQPQHTKPGAAVARGSLLERLDDGSPVDLAALGAAPALDEGVRQRIARLHRRMRSLAPRELLGVPEDADFAQLKRAYFAASKELHPDRFYGRDIGRYRALLSDIFATLSAAFDTLQTDLRKK